MTEEKNHKMTMPSMGEGVFEAHIMKWLKNNGEYVEKDEPILEVSTDKVDTEIVVPFQDILSKPTYKQIKLFK